MSAIPRAHFTLTAASDSAGSGQSTPRSRSPGPPGSPPPYSLTPPESDPNSPFLFKRAASSPHLRSPPQSPPLHYPHSSSSSRIPSSSALNVQHQRYRQSYVHSDIYTSDDPDTDADASDTVMYTSPQPTLAGTLRARLLGKGKGRADDTRMRVEAMSATSAGETETEGEDLPRGPPTARIGSSSSLPFLSSISSTATAPVPSPLKPFIPLLWELSRLLSIVPAVIGTLYNLYHVLYPPTDSFWLRLDYFISALWSILTGWQCLMMTSGLLKRWRVYYSPLPTLIRLLGLQAICWPATHLTLTFLEHHKRPLICWAVIATTTCCSRSVQMWVTSNIIVFPHHSHHSHASAHIHHSSADRTSSMIASLCSPSRREAIGNGNGLTMVEKERMKMGRRRKWDWGAVGAKCALPAGVLYFVMAWVEVLRREWEGN
ncbi:N-glycosylation protein-domain-containing protein [Cristinia sonorae]|uniref:N-glycosylation protein-domain-containing protein n=1 Tax=Cristinia sonorae TaxID=1940300 RepID=A0A8K0UVD0_9AGAR|nr:N-glycosylation protein-domain-containing protein [Cristinia sonorae]